jgi:hypothetical protein
MTRGTGLRMLMLSAGLAVLFGCGDDDDDDGGGMATGLRSANGAAIEFFDDFTGTFPDPNWDIKRGNPFATPNVGNEAPGLALLGNGDDIRLRGEFVFSTSEAFTLSFDLAAHHLQSSSRFKFRIREVGDGGEASFETRIDDGEIRLKIQGSDEEIDFPMAEDGHYELIEFKVDAKGVASWRINGTSFMTRGGFRDGTSRIEIEAGGGQSTKFVVDNVMLTRP